MESSLRVAGQLVIRLCDEGALVYNESNAKTSLLNQASAKMLQFLQTEESKNTGKSHLLMGSPVGIDDIEINTVLNSLIKAELISR